jgi:hypothetical protein
MIRAKRFLASENLAKPVSRCKMFHVEHHFSVEIVPGDRELFHVEHSAFLGCENSDLVPRGTIPRHRKCPSRKVVPRESRLQECSTWNGPLRIRRAA